MIIEPTGAAVIGLHFLRDVIEPDRPFGAFFHAMVVRNRVLENTARVLTAARAAGLTVIHARIVFPRDYAGIEPITPLYRTVIDSGALQEGSEGVEVVDALAPHPDDVVLDHLGTSAFVGGGLQQLLDSRGVTTLVTTGVATNVIVEGTARDAGNRGFRTFVLSDCCSAADPATHESSLATLAMLTSGVTTSDDFLSAIGVTAA